MPKQAESDVIYSNLACFLNDLLLLFVIGSILSIYTVFKGGNAFPLSSPDNGQQKMLCILVLQELFKGVPKRLPVFIEI